MMPEQQERQIAEQKVLLFERQFGEAYRLLAYHAALPLVLTPELVHYLRTEFLLNEAERVPWEAEADLLLSDLCSQVGYELYVMDAPVRSYLLEQMPHDDRIPPERMQAVAQVLISYVTYLSQINPGQRQRELQAQRWAAMGYLGDESCREVAREIAEQFEQGASQGDSLSVKAEFARLAQITQELKPLVQASPELVEFAKRVGQSIRSPQSLTPEERRQGFVVGDRVLRLPDAIVLSPIVDELLGLKTFEFDVVEFVEAVEVTRTGGLQRIPHEFNVATIQIPSTPVAEGIQCSGIAEILVIEEDENGGERTIPIVVRGDELEWESPIGDDGQIASAICHTGTYHGEHLDIEWSVYEYPEGEIRYYVAEPEAIGGEIRVVRNFAREDFSIVHNLEDYTFPVEIVLEPKQDWQYLERLSEDVILELVKVPAGSFVMGAPEDELESFDHERLQHEVSIPEFYIGKYPVTQQQWRFVASLPQVERELELDPFHFKGDGRPVERVSWLDAVEFCVRLSRHTGREYRLPTEAEWEYACRAGTTTPFHSGETIDARVANYDANYVYRQGIKGEYRNQTTSVGSFGVANNFGLYDMHGNVREWCLDHWHENYEGAPVDGSAWIDPEASEKAARLLRGGSWTCFPRYCRSAYRNRDDAAYRFIDVGFRVVSPVSTLSVLELIDEMLDMD